MSEYPVYGPDQDTRSTRISRTLHTVAYRNTPVIVRKTHQQCYKEIRTLLKLFRDESLAYLSSEKVSYY